MRSLCRRCIMFRVPVMQISRVRKTHAGEQVFARFFFLLDSGLFSGVRVCADDRCYWYF